MHLALLLPLALLTPLLLAVLLFMPAYAGILGATYLIYDKGEGLHPLSGRLFDVFYIIEAYFRLFHYWLEHTATLSFIGYTLPILGLPLFGLVLGVWLSWRLGRKAYEFFQAGGAL